MDEFTLKIISGGGKLFLYFPIEMRRQIKFPFGTLIKITIYNQNNSFSLIMKYNYNLTLKKEIIKKLDLKKGNLVKIQISELAEFKKPLSPFIENKIDMLFFIPEKNRKGSDFYFEVFDNLGEKFIRIVSIHKRGSSSSIILRRYANPKILGFLLGQIQSEGTKTNYDSLEFCNKNLYEIKDFLSYLNYFGISKEMIFVKLDYHSSLKSSVNKILSDFQKFVGLKVNYISESSKSRGGYGFKIIARNVLISEIFLNSLERMKKFLSSENFEGTFKFFCESYLTKILAGDGSFEITSKNRRKFQSRLTIADGNIYYLKHYDILLKKFGFNPRINEKYGYVRSLCNLNLARRLFEMNTFDNNSNKQKLLLFIENNKVSSKKSGA